MTLPDPVQYAIPVFVVLIVAEMLLARYRGTVSYETRDTVASLMMGFGNSVAGVLFGSIAVATYYLIHDYALFDIPAVWWVIPICFVADDFAYYWFHRFSHECRYFWASHVVHHSSQHYNLSTALRQTWTGRVSFSFIFYLPFVYLGFPPEIMFFCGGLNLVYQFWIHTEAIDKMGPLELFMNTPSHHRVHHGTNPRYLDANYAGTFIIWDKMFGTFVPEAEEDPVEYGIIKRLGTFNPLRIAFHEWIDIGKDVVSSRSLGEAVSYIFQAPGWSPDGSRKTAAQLKAEWRAEQDRRSSTKLKKPVPAE